MRLSQNVDYSTDLVMGYEVKNLIMGRPPLITYVTYLVLKDANTFFGKKLLVPCLMLGIDDHPVLTEAPAPGRRDNDRHPLTVKYRAKHKDTFHDICD